MRGSNEPMQQATGAGMDQTLKAVMEASPVGILVFDDHERIVYANEPAERLLGKKATESGLRCGDFISCANRHKDPKVCGHTPPCPDCPLLQSIRAALAGEEGAGVREGESLIDRDPGYGPLWIRYKVNSLLLDGRRAAIMVIDDITGRKEAEAALRQSEAKYKKLVDNAGEVVLVAQDKRVVFVNRTITRMAGYLPEELVGKPFADYIHPDDRKTVVERHIQRLQGEALPGVYPFRIITKAGEIRHVEGHIVPIEWEGRPATLNFLADITERREAEAANEKWQAQLHQAQRMESIGVLAGGVAHEFNNLLTTIIGNAQLALTDLPKDAPIREDIEEIKKAGDRGALLTRRLMTFSRREVFHPEPLNLNDLIHDMETLLRRLIRENIALRLVLGEDLRPIVADPVQMEQVVMGSITGLLMDF